MTDAYWCELAWLGGDEPAAGVTIELDGDRFGSIAAGTPCPAGATRLDGLTLPGFANAHSHAFHRALRGRTHGGTGSFWTWREQMYALAAALEPEAYYRLARATFAEMALAGFTTVGEFHYLHHDAAGRPHGDPNQMGHALIGAALQAGLRITLLDTCYLQSGIAPDGSGVAPEGVQRRFTDGTVERWAERVDALAGRHQENHDVRIGAAIHSVRACSPADAAAVAAWAASGARPLHAHVSEQPAENEACLAAFGRTPTALLDDAGALGERFTAVHATHVTDDDIERLRRSGSAVCLCPTTERDLADGIGPASRFGPLAVGTDSHAVIDAFEEARAVELDERLATQRRGSTGPAALLAALTSGGHRSLGWPDGGTLSLGAPADLVTVSLDSARLSGTRPADALAAVVFAASAPDISHVVRAGNYVVRHGRHVSIDVAAELCAALGQLP